MPPHFIKDDDELMQRHLLGKSSGDGFVYNDYSGNAPSGSIGNVLHRAGCPYIAKANTKKPKVFFDSIGDASRWISQQRGNEGERWRRCNCCDSERSIGNKQKFDAAQLITKKTRKANQNSLNSAAPFTEGRVEDFLQPWLEGEGYTVKKRVRVSNGIVDIVAGNHDSEWVIEAKGEDKGGFGTAEMNFRIGIAQICSRMERRLGRRFALAIPLTSHFKRLLLKHRDFTIFERMEIWLFIATADGEISLIPPNDVQGFVDSLST